MNHPSPSSKPSHSESLAQALEPAIKWFERRGWQPFSFQLEAWQARLGGESGLIHVPTGAGKTYAALIGALLHAQKTDSGPGLKILYLTPLKAVARDIKLAIEEAIAGFAPGFRVEDRTGDTSQSRRAQQRLKMPEVLITTPESLELLLCDAEHERHFAKLETLILDEWHECLSTKRGSLLELSLTRLRRLRPDLSSWALSATIGNIEEAAQTAVGTETTPRLIQAAIRRPIVIESLFPEQIDTFPWAGSMGLKMADALIRRLDPGLPTLIFTNTRNMAERWYQALIDRKPEWREITALHHGSIDREERERIEAGIKEGTLSFVVCTSSLDLGVDFGPVEKVVQIGSPKGIARILQRAGRSAHRPGGTSTLNFVPTHALELLEIAAVRRALARGWVEERRPLREPLDVLVQHLVSRALGGGFTEDEIASEVRTATSYRHLSDETLRWAFAFIRDGGFTLQSYPAFRRVELDYGVYRVRDPRIARLHRMNIGTITSDASVQLKFMRGKSLGQVEESFISKLKKGDRFLFSGRVLEFIMMKDLTAIVKLAKGGATVLPSWTGSRLPYSSPLSVSVRELLEEWGQARADSSEAVALRHVLEAQSKLSGIPKYSETLVELLQTREGTHLFLYPFEGRLIHEGLGALLALRLGRRQKGTFSITCNDYGIEILSGEEFPFLEILESAQARGESLFSHANAEEDLREALNLSQLGRQRFREIARVAGLMHSGHPGARKSARQLQMSAGLLYDVFRRYEPDHPLIHQAENQVVGEITENGRFDAVLKRLAQSHLLLKTVARPTPLGFPLLADRLSVRLSTESLADRLERLKRQWVSV